MSSKLSVDSPPNSPLPMILFECSSSLGIAQPSGVRERERERKRERERERERERGEGGGERKG